MFCGKFRPLFLAYFFRTGKNVFIRDIWGPFVTKKNRSTIGILYQFGIGSGHALTILQDQTRARSRDDATLNVFYIIIK